MYENNLKYFKKRLEQLYQFNQSLPHIIFDTDVFNTEIDIIKKLTAYREDGNTDFFYGFLKKEGELIMSFSYNSDLEPLESIRERKAKIIYGVVCDYSKIEVRFDDTFYYDYLERFGFLVPKAGNGEVVLRNIVVTNSQFKKLVSYCDKKEIDKSTVLKQLEKLALHKCCGYDFTLVASLGAWEVLKDEAFDRILTLLK